MKISGLRVVVESPTPDVNQVTKPIDICFECSFSSFCRRRCFELTVQSKPFQL